MAGYQSDSAILDFATRFERELNAVIQKRMQQLGIPQELIGLHGFPGIDDGKAFVRFPTTQMGGNQNPAVNPNWMPGIALDHGILDVAHPTMLQVLAWGQNSTVLRDRMDAVIVHEFIEATVVPPRIGYAGSDDFDWLHGDVVDRIGWLHKWALFEAPHTTLPITRRAREILFQYCAANHLVEGSSS